MPGAGFDFRSIQGKELRFRKNIAGDEPLIVTKESLRAEEEEDGCQDDARQHH